MLVPVPFEPSTCRVIPLTLGTPPPPGLVSAVTIVSCFGPGRKLSGLGRPATVSGSVLSAGTWMTIVSGVLPDPGVQLTMPPFARVRVDTLPRNALGKVQKRFLPPWSAS